MTVFPNISSKHRNSLPNSLRPPHPNIVLPHPVASSLRTSNFVNQSFPRASSKIAITNSFSLGSRKFPPNKSLHDDLETFEPKFHLMLRPSSSNSIFTFRIEESGNFPLTEFPSFEKIDLSNIKELVEKASSNFNYIYSCQKNYNNNAKFQNREVAQALDSLISLFPDEAEKEKLTEENINDIYNMAKKHISHKFPDISRTYVIGESVAPYYISNWQQLESVYTLLAKLCNQVAPLISDQQFFGIVSNLASPVKEERESVLFFIEELCKNSDDHKNKVFSVMTSVIESFRDGHCLHFCIPPILNFLLPRLNELPLPLDRSYFSKFRNVFYPTIISSNVVDFYPSILPFSRFFQTKDSATAVWCIRFLFKHWPITNSQKQVIFLHQLQCLLSYLSPSYLPALSKALISRLLLCINSVNYKVAVAALKICQEEDFMSLLAKVAGGNAVTLIPSIETAQVHWNQEVCQAALIASSVVKKVKFAGQMRLTGSRLFNRFSQQKNSWMNVYNIAIKNDKSLNQNDIKNKISSFQKLP